MDIDIIAKLLVTPSDKEICVLNSDLEVLDSGLIEDEQGSTQEVSE
jgi:hypothetical protein